MRVLVIPEDFSQDQYVLKPIVKAMLAAVGRPRANVQVCQDPPLRGIEQAVRWERISEIIDTYPVEERLEGKLEIGINASASDARK